MDITLVASTNNIRTKQEALLFGRAAARICYTEKGFSGIVEEENPMPLIDATLDSGHHSVYEHVHLSFYIDGIPKMGAMILNNERPYVTSEKSARYTQMNPEHRQKALYCKWLEILKTAIAQKYPHLGETKTAKLAQENARYMISVFTSTKMLYTLSFRQLNRIMHAFRAEIKQLPDNEFTAKTKKFMAEFLESPATSQFFEERLDYRNKPKRLSIFAENGAEEEFGENYSTTYENSFAYLAQAHRHRTLNYSMAMCAPKFFIPAILTAEQAEQWTADIGSIAEHDFPQGMLISISERGHYTDFIAKMRERLCEQAQWEIMDRTRKTLLKYIRETKNPAVRLILEQYADKETGAPAPACRMPGSKRCSGGPFGPSIALERLV
jgi:thymidylate synthase ThyX